MSMVEKEIEAKIIAAIEALELDNLEVVGTWNVPEDETASTVARLTVSVSPRVYSRYTVCEATFSAELEIAVRAELGHPSAYAGEISDLLHTWNMNRNNEAKTALGVDDVVSIGGIKVTGGDAPYLDRESSTWYCSFTFDITGFVAHTETTTTT